MEALKKQLESTGQEHLLKYWDELESPQKDSLSKELSNIDLENINKYYKQAMHDLDHASDKIDNLLEPLPEEVCGSITRSSLPDIQQYEEAGLEAIGLNYVAVLLLAGGQGTRLGVSYPKGMYDVGMPSSKTLYQIQAERILKLERLAAEKTGNKCTIPWYIMTSEHTRHATDEFFKGHNHFGLQPENVVLFEQGLLPCLDFDGKIILADKHKVALAPDGNGGLYRALRNWNILKDMQKRGIRYVHVYCVDNILVKMADPVFIGFCLSKGASCGAKVVEKTVPTEAVGVVCKVEGKYQVVEYSEITQKTAEMKKEDGTLKFNAGNICNHFFTLDFLQHVTSPEQENALAYHVAKKKIPYINNNEEIIKPTQPNGIKMEKFVFDVFHFARNFAVWEVLREDEFSPLKNADTAAKDTPTTCRKALSGLHCRYILKAGGKFVHKDGTLYNDTCNGSESGQGDSQKEDRDDASEGCEISPLASYAGEGLESLVNGQQFVPPVQILMSYNDSKPVLKHNNN